MRGWVRKLPPVTASEDSLDCGCTITAYWRHSDGITNVEKIETVYCPKHDPEKEKS